MGRRASRLWVVDTRSRVRGLSGIAARAAPGAGARRRARRSPRGSSPWSRSSSRRPQVPAGDESKPVRAQIDRALIGVSSTYWRGTRDREVAIVSAAQPVFVGDDIVGAVVVEETTASDPAAAAIRAREPHRADARRVPGGVRDPARLRQPPRHAHPPPARAGRRGDRRAGPHPRRHHAHGREGRDRRPRAHDRRGAGAPSRLQRLPRADGLAPVARAAHARGGGALLARQPAEPVAGRRGARLPRPRGGGRGAPLAPHLAAVGGHAPGEDAGERRARALRPRGGGARLRGGLPRRLPGPRVRHRHPGRGPSR